MLQEFSMIKIRHIIPAESIQFAVYYPVLLVSRNYSNCQLNDTCYTGWVLKIGRLYLLTLWTKIFQCKVENLKKIEKMLASPFGAQGTCQIFFDFKKISKFCFERFFDSTTPKQYTFKTVGGQFLLPTLYIAGIGKCGTIILVPKLC